MNSAFGIAYETLSRRITLRVGDNCSPALNRCPDSATCTRFLAVKEDKDMSTGAALDIPEYQGLTDFETRLATALMHARFRGSFSQIHPRKIDEGGTVLEIWGRTASDEPAFRFHRQGDCVVAVSECKGLVVSSDSIEGLVAKISSELPPPLPF